MPEIDMLLQVEGLFANFYTYQGVVKALDGVSFNIKKGETFGLVGETGCGKSVTANCVLRLIPSPPGKIEGGHIYFMMPLDVRKRREELTKKMSDLKAKGDSGSDEFKGAQAELKKIENEFDLLKKSMSYMRKIRGKYISMIFQEPMSALNPVIKAGDQISEVILLHEKKELAHIVLRRMEGELSQPIDPLKKAGIVWNRWFYQRMTKNPSDLLLRLASKIPLLRRYERPIKKVATERAEDMLRLVRIPDPQTIVSSYPHELSGGMQQRVMIAMALACKPLMLIADEPTTALDVTIQAQILKLMRDLQEEMGTSILLITHNLGVVAETCERVGVMYAGVMAEIGPVKSIFKQPLHPYTQGLMKAIPKVTVESTRLESIEGNVPNLVKPPIGCRFNPRCPFAREKCKTEKPEAIEVEPGHFVACHNYAEVGR